MTKPQKQLPYEDEVLRRMLRMPPKLHDEMKLTKPKPALAKKTAKRVK